MTLAALARDRAAPAAALPIMVILTEEGLLTSEWQRLKLLTVVTRAGRTHRLTSQALTWLVTAGYLERLNDPFLGRLYRLKGPA